MKDRLAHVGERVVARIVGAVGARRRRPLLLVGHPRSGTGYAAALLRGWGLDVGHERVGRHGVSAWYAYGAHTPPLCRKIDWDTYDFAHVVHVVRRARPTVLSVAFTESASERYRFEILGQQLTNDRIADAITSVDGWTDHLRARFPIAHVLRVEDPRPTFAFVQSVVDVPLTFRLPEGPVNARPRPVADLAPYEGRLDALDAKLGY